MLSRVDRFALLLCVLGVFASFFVACVIFENIPHTEDEISYLWQARVFASGRLSVPTPPHAKSMFVPFVVDYQGRRFTKYPPGWPAVLSLGVLVGLDVWLNPLLGGVGIWLAYSLGKKLFCETVGWIASMLTLTSPFFLLNSGSFLSSPLALVLTGVFALCWFEAFSSPASSHATRKAVFAGLSLGWLALARPIAALGVAFPFGVHGLTLLVCGDWSIRKRILLTSIVAAFTSGLLFAWQYLMTGNALLNPYTLWWSFDKIGFGAGYGISPDGHNLMNALENSAIMLDAARRDVFGWGNYSWLLLPFGVWAVRKNRPSWVISAVFISLVGFYLVYWAHVTRYGPRYYYEGMYSLTLLSAAGIHWLARKDKLRFALTSVLMTSLVGYNLFVYLPARLAASRAIYGITRAQLAPFQIAEAHRLTPALVFVSVKENNAYGSLNSDWPQYGGLLELQNPELTSPFIFAISRGNSEDAALMMDYPNRHVIYYYPDEPYEFYFVPRK